MRSLNLNELLVLYKHYQTTAVIQSQRLPQVAESTSPIAIRAVAKVTSGESNK